MDYPAACGSLRQSSFVQNFVSIDNRSETLSTKRGIKFASPRILKTKSYADDKNNVCTRGVNAA